MSFTRPIKTAFFTFAFTALALAQYTPPGGGGISCTGSASIGYVATATTGGSNPPCSWQSVGAASVDAATVKNALYVAVTGTNTLTGSTTTAYPTYSAGVGAYILIANTNSGAVTVNFNSRGAKAITKNGTTALAGGELIAGRVYFIVYDGTQYQITQPYTNGTNGQALTSNGTGGFGTPATLATVATSGSASDLGSGTLPAGRLPAMTGDATSSGGSNSLTVTKVNGTLFSGLATGLLKNTTSTGIPSIAAAGTDYAPATSGATILKGNGSGGTSTTGCTESSGALSCTGSVGAGVGAGTTGAVVLNGTTSGTVTISVQDAAGTWTEKKPTSAGSASQVLSTDGSGNESWVTRVQTIASGTAALGTSAISSGACATVVTVSATGTATTDNLMADFNADPTSTTGFSASANGMLTIIKYPTLNNVNFKVCNNTQSSVTPGAVTLNWRVLR
jgi:hypothetical protein